MKKLFFLLAITASHITLAQTEYEDFKVEDQEIIYQKVFTQDSATISKLAEYYRALPYVSHVDASGGLLHFDINEIMVDYAKFQFPQVGTPTVIQTGKYSGKVSIAVRDGRYRVTVKSIQFTGDTGYKKVTEKEDLTGHATINSGTALNRDWCRPNMLGLLDKAFTDKLEFEDEAGGDW